MMERMGNHNISWREKYQRNITGGTTEKKNEGADSWKDQHKAEKQEQTLSEEPKDQQETGMVGK